ncbi:reverse transcriptase [Lasius niger]|uniref:Reverse transcriptase n=1 Tax=Lasius niger TaxID=67767 RepID=A0A0J7NDW4_LASNI|nr:reverse transcriptase [Lasius niger]
MLVSETHFTNKNYLKIPNYSVYHTMHPDSTAHGGSAVIIRNNIKHYEANKFQKDFLQATSVIIEDLSGELTISALYCPPKHAIKKEHFERYFTTLGKRFLAAGDYNAKHTFWGSRLSTTKGRELYKTIEAHNLDVVSTGEPTYWPSDRTKIPDLIDFAILKGIPKLKCSARTCLELTSYHSPILLTLNTSVIYRPRECVLHNKHTNWSIFRETVASNLNTNISLKTSLDITNAVELFNKCVQRAAWDATPVSTYQKFNYNCPATIREKILEKRHIRKQWQANRSPKTKSELNKITKELKKMLDDIRNQGVREYLEDLSPTAATDYSLWKATKKLKQPQIMLPPVRQYDNNWARSNSEKADVFAKHLASVFYPSPSEISQEEENTLIRTLEEPYQLESSLNKITKGEVFNIIKKNIDPKKTPGYDLITGKILQELPNEGFIFLTQLFNAILRTNFFPPQWKVAEIIMIPKPGKPPEEAKSYRPISLLPIPSKVLERIILSRLLPVIRERNLIPDHQFGFREKHSTLEQVHRIWLEIRKSLEARKYCSAVFLDITQAFDKVWFTGLFYKLKTKLPANLYAILRNYLENRHFRIKQQEARSELYPILSGVPQGSILGPVLYLLYTADLPTTVKTLTATYADDTAILAAHENPDVASNLLQTSLDKTQKWLKNGALKLMTRNQSMLPSRIEEKHVLRYS